MFLNCMKYVTNSYSTSVCRLSKGFTDAQRLGQPGWENGHGEKSAPGPWWGEDGCCWTLRNLSMFTAHGWKILSRLELWKSSWCTWSFLWDIRYRRSVRIKLLHLLLIIQNPLIWLWMFAYGKDCFCVLFVYTREEALLYYSSRSLRVYM